MQNHFFQCKRFASATHIVSFHIGNIPYAPSTAIPFGLGLKNPMDLRFIFGRGLENLIRIRLRFVRGMENPAGIGLRFTPGIKNPTGLRFVFIRRIKNRIGIGFIRPPVWPSMGRIQYAPTLSDENSSGFWFVFIRWRQKWPGIAWIVIPGRAFGVVRL